MFTNNELKLLLERKKVELECLGIKPLVYFMVSKFLSKEYKFVYKDGRTYIFNKKEEYCDEDDLVDEIILIFNLDKIVANEVVNEWCRDKLIYRGMSEQSSKYWAWLNIPEPLSLKLEDEFNF